MPPPPAVATHLSGSMLKSERVALPSPLRSAKGQRERIALRLKPSVEKLAKAKGRSNAGAYFCTHAPTGTPWNGSKPPCTSRPSVVVRSATVSTPVPVPWLSLSPHSCSTSTSGCSAAIVQARAVQSLAPSDLALVEHTPSCTFQVMMRTSAGSDLPHWADCGSHCARAVASRTATASRAAALVDMRGLRGGVDGLGPVRMQSCARFADYIPGRVRQQTIPPTRPARYGRNVQ